VGTNKTKMSRIALAQAIASMETARKETDPIGALRDWRVQIAQQIIRPAGPGKKAKKP
jgi:hypothetical protein